jgi:hypothetical protein
MRSMLMNKALKANRKANNNQKDAFQKHYHR